MDRKFIYDNLTLISIIIFLSLYFVVILSKPNFIFNNDESLRSFGIGFRRKTIIPAWLVAIILSIFSYFCVLYYIAYPRI
jgi:hypothetical protein